MTIPDRILTKVEKPARYIGNEINMVKKNPGGGERPAEIRFALCFPDVYEVGMSHLGLSILYYFLNRRTDTYCERAFAPWPDMEKALREEGLPLSALETGDGLQDFDFVGFTLQYELCATNVLNMLDLSGIPLFAKERGEDDPIICGGGPCAYNPEPYADFFDFFYIGEGEAALDAVLDIYKQNKAAGGGRRGFLLSILNVPGVYVPGFYDVSYKPTGEIERFSPNEPQAPAAVTKAFVKDLDAAFFPENQLVPHIETVHDRVTLECFRGCIRGCRFCQAGYIFRPVREKSAETLLTQAEALIAATGHEEISLLSLSTSDYTSFNALAKGLLTRFAEAKVNLSLPSLRIDAVSLDLMEKTQGVRKSSLTFAPEAGSQRLRDVINKGIDEDEILNGATLAFQGGWERVKLYFMLGLPTETDEDVKAIATLADRIVSLFKAHGGKGRSVSVNLSASCFVPKPFTPFQWEGQDSAAAFVEKQQLLRRSLRKKQVRVSAHDPAASVIEAALARGDRRVGQAVLNAWKRGARFDGWSEYFSAETWDTAFAGAGLDIFFYAGRKRELDEVLPWDHIDIGVTKAHFIKERKKAYAAALSPNCRDGCSLCGIQKLCGGVCVGV